MSSLIPFNQNSSSWLPSHFDGFLDDFFSDSFLPSMPARSLMRDTFKVDISENEKEYVVEAEMPGISKKDVDINFNEGKLILSVNKEESEDKSDKNYVHRERRSMSMARSIYLADADEEAVKAKLENGMLEITVPKKTKESNSKKITID